MRTFIAGLSVLLCGFLLIGAMGAPIMQSQSYYINDHARVLEQEYRDIMLETAQELYEKTGVRMVMLTIENLDGHSPEEYAELIFRSWEIGANAIGVLILFSTEENRFVIWSNADIDDERLIEAADKTIAAQGSAFAVYACFEYAAQSIYNSPPVISDNYTSDTQDKRVTLNISGTEATEDTAAFGSEKDILFLALLVLVIFVFMRMTRRNSKRHAQTNRNEVESLRRIYSPDEPIAVRTDDFDYPSGFGGLGNRKAIYCEDVNEADDIGIIKRKSYDVSDKEELI